jgi:tetratricopeptide (TPR) repeat protein
MPLEEIAYHLSKGGETERGADYYKQAGFSYKDQGQISSATAYLTKSINLLPEGSPVWQELLLETSRLLVQAGQYREAQGALEKMQTYPSSLLHELQGWLAYKQRHFPSARNHYEEAIRLLPGEKQLQKILFENALANVDLQEGKPQEGATRFRKTLSWETDLPPAEQEKITNNNLGLALILLGDLEGALEFYRTRQRNVKSVDQEAILLNGMGYVCLQASRYEETITYLKRAMQLAEETGALHTLFSIMGNLITALIKESRYAESIPLLQKMVSYQQRLGTVRDVSYNLLRQGVVYLTLGISEAAQSCFDKGKKTALESSEEGLANWIHLMEGYWEREHGTFEKAGEDFRETEFQAKKMKDAELTAWAVYARADLAFEENNLAECRRLLEEIRTEPKDEEFGCRLQLLRSKVTAAENRKEDPDPLFAAVEARALKGSFREILWEVCHGWGEAQKIRGHLDQARLLFEKGIKVTESIATPLPEEYRDRYLRQRSRKKLYDAWRKVTSPAKKGFAAKIKELFS